MTERRDRGGAAVRREAGKGSGSLADGTPSYERSEHGV